MATWNSKNTADPKLIAYADAVNRLARVKSNLIFDNSGEQHAAIVLAAIFNNAHREVRIFANNMDGQIGDNEEYLNALTSYVLSGKELKIILNSDEYFKPEARWSKSVQFLKGLKHNNLEIKVADDEFREKVKLALNNEDKLWYFTIGDAQMYRIETNNETHRAKCCFNDCETSSGLSKLFDSRFSLLPNVD